MGNGDDWVSCVSTDGAGGGRGLWPRPGSLSGTTDSRPRRLFGMVLGQQAVDMAKRYLARTAQASIHHDVRGAQGPSKPD